MDFVPSVALKGIDLLIKNSGEDPEKLMQEVGFDPSLLDRPDTPVTGQLFNDLIEHSARSLNQRFFGLQLAAIQGASILGPLWFLLRNASTVEDSIQSLIENYPSHTLITYWSIEKTAKGSLLVYDVSPTIKGEHTQVIELGLGIFCLNFKSYFGKEWNPKGVYLQCGEPYEKRPMTDVLGQDVFFNQEMNAILLTHEDLEKPISSSNQLQHLYYENLIASRADFNPRSVAIQAENIINTNLIHNTCTLEFVAKSLNINPRTFRHQLKQQGTSFQKLLTQAKLDIALRYLRESKLSVTEIAERLHYSETAVLSRFVKKHTGSTPQQLRLK